MTVAQQRLGRISQLREVCRRQRPWRIGTSSARRTRVIQRILLRGLVFAAPLLSSAHAHAQSRDTIVKRVTMPRYHLISEASEELSIGQLEGAPEYTFTTVSGIAIGPTGSMLVLESPLRGTPTLRLYDERGKFTRNVGRVGPGPGEYKVPAAVATTPDGRFLLLDAFSRRISVYTASGSFIKSWSIPRFEVTLNAPSRMRVDPSGIIAVRVQLGRSTNGGFREGVIRLREGGAIIDTLAEPDLPDVAMRVSKTRTQGGSKVSSTLVTPYSPRAHWQWSPLGYYVTGVSSTYALDVRLPTKHSPQSSRPAFWRSGDAVISIRTDFEPVEISAAERADRKTSFEEQLRRLRGDQVGSLTPIPTVKPYFEYFYVADDGRIWVDLHAPSERHTPAKGLERGDIASTWREPNLMDVFEPDGSYLGRFSFPPDFKPRTFRGNHVWGYVKDEYDVPYIRKYRVAWNRLGAEPRR